MRIFVNLSSGLHLGRRAGPPTSRGPQYHKCKLTHWVHVVQVINKVSLSQVDCDLCRPMTDSDNDFCHFKTANHNIAINHLQHNMFKMATSLTGVRQDKRRKILIMCFSRLVSTRMWSQLCENFSEECGDGACQTYLTVGAWLLKNPGRN